MAEIKFPFEYNLNLIGEEIIFRCLNRQEVFANKNEYGMTWTEDDFKIRKAEKAQADKMKADSFEVPPGYPKCELDPPCPWPKDKIIVEGQEVDYLKTRDLMPIIVSKEDNTSYSIGFYERKDDDKTSYTTIGTIADYKEVESKLPADKRDDFRYYTNQGIIPKYGPAVLIIKKIINGSLEDRFAYLFEFVAG